MEDKRADEFRDKVKLLAKEMKIDVVVLVVGYS